MHPYTNRLIHETSPYLLQHAHNPVDWYAWSDEAFARARQEDKPVLVSIGYAACHWCHVMERESFEDPAVAAVMNTHFINIKVDREERPDVDHLYMDAVQAISGGGGWPLNVFLLPDRRPFYGGTYFPPQRAFNRASWTEVLLAIAQSYREGRDKLAEDAAALTRHLQQSNAFGQSPGSLSAFNAASLEEAFRQVMKGADKEWGGFGKAPKFPQTFTISFLLRFAWLTGRDEARQQAVLSLDKMVQGGLYDQVGGGFARYATDREWLVPHFEKMLYDNALLVATLAEAFQLTGTARYREVIAETLAFVERELMHPGGGFYSALDADSEGEEGRFYVWDGAEVDAVLGSDPVFKAYYGITEGGNWEGRNILFVRTPPEAFARQQGLEPEDLRARLARGRQALLAKRAERPRPQLDDKVLLGWNALMNWSYSRAYAATGVAHYRAVAVRNMEFLLAHFRGADGLLHHTWKEGVARYPAFLDDYAYLIAALLELAQVTADSRWLTNARTLAETVMAGFSDTATPLFFFTHAGQTDVLLRKKEVYDGATPSGNAVMAGNLLRLGLLLDLPDWKARGEAMVAAFGALTLRHPTAFGVWLGLLLEAVYGTAEVAIVGPEAEGLLQEVLALYLPHKMVMAAKGPETGFPLLREKAPDGKTLIYLCKNYACQAPVSTVAAFKSLIISK